MTRVMAMGMPIHPSIHRIVHQAPPEYTSKNNIFQKKNVVFEKFSIDYIYLFLCSFSGILWEITIRQWVFLSQYQKQQHQHHFLLMTIMMMGGQRRLSSYGNLKGLDMFCKCLTFKYFDQSLRRTNNGADIYRKFEGTTNEHSFQF